MTTVNPAHIATARRHTVGDLLRRSARRVPDKTAIVYRASRQSYAELDDAVNRTANALAQRRICKGDRVALLSHNNHGYVVACFALARLGAVAVPVNFMLSAAEVAFILQHSGASGVIVEDALLGVAQEAIETAGLPDGLRVRGMFGAAGGDLPRDWEPFATWAKHDDATEPEAAIDDDDVLQLMYTSGTESRPKGVMMTSRSLITQYISCIVDGRYQQSDVEIHALPLFHVAAQHCFLMPGLCVGATNVILGRPRSGSAARERRAREGHQAVLPADRVDQPAAAPQLRLSRSVLAAEGVLRRGFCRKQLAGYKTPKYFVLVDAIPKNASGKILKRNLRTAFAHLAE